LQIVLEALRLEETAAIDSAPVPCVSYKRSKQTSDFLGTADYGVCSSKAMKYFGCKIHGVVGLTGIIMGFLLTPANGYDNQPVVDLLDSFAHHLTHLLGDGAYNDAVLQGYLEQNRSLHLLAPVKENQPPKRSRVCSNTAQPLALDLRNGQCSVARAIAPLQALCEEYLGSDDTHCGESGRS
jgi:hypothetical protein